VDPIGGNVPLILICWEIESNVNNVGEVPLSYTVKHEVDMFGIPVAGISLSPLVNEHKPNL
jgi:hypothetical protein